MLVVSRKTDESILIEGGIEVRIVEIRGNKVRLGITAPDRWVHRKEIVDKINAEKQAAAEGLG